MMSLELTYFTEESCKVHIESKDLSILIANCSFHFLFPLGFFNVSIIPSSAGFLEVNVLLAPKTSP